MQRCQSYIRMMDHIPEAVPVAVVITSQEILPTLLISQHLQGLIHITQNVVGIVRRDVAEGVDVLFNSSRR